MFQRNISVWMKKSKYKQFTKTKPTKKKIEQNILMDAEEKWTGGSETFDEFTGESRAGFASHTSPARGFPVDRGGGYSVPENRNGTDLHLYRTHIGLPTFFIATRERPWRRNACISQRATLYLFLRLVFSLLPARSARTIFLSSNFIFYSPIPIAVSDFSNRNIEILFYK